MKLHIPLTASPILDPGDIVARLGSAPSARWGEGWREGENTLQREAIRP